MDNTIARQAMAENGGKWQIMVGNGFSRVLSHGHQGGQAGNGRKWLKMAENGGKKVHRDYLVGNGFPRILSHSPTTGKVIYNIEGIHSIYGLLDLLGT